MKMARNKGITFIELLIILVVVVILFGFALPKYLSIRDRDRLKSAEDVANLVAAASTLNYKECNAGIIENCKKINSCSEFSSLITTKLPRGMLLTNKPGIAFPTIAGTTAECLVTYASKPVEFKAIANP